MRWTPEDFAKAASAFRREVAGLIRRYTLGTVPGSIWQVVGHYLFDTTRPETHDLELFHGIGFFARPPSGSASAEAIAAAVGGPNGQVIVATRDEATRSLVDDIGDDETAPHNTQARVHIKSDGTIEARTHSGTASQLVTKADFDAFSAWVRAQFDPGAGHHHVVSGAATTTMTTSPNSTPATPPSPHDAPPPSYTQKFKAE